MAKITEFFEALQDTIMDGASNDEKRIMDLTAEWLSLDAELQGDVDDTGREYNLYRMDELDKEIKRLREAC